MKERDEKGKDGRAKRNAWFLGSSSFLNDVGGEMITPILPFYVTALGGGGIALGLLSGLRDGLSSIFKVFGGWFSDRVGDRKTFVFLGYFFSFIAKFFIGISSSWQQLLAFVSLERFGKFRDAPRDAIISETRKHRAEDFGLVQMMDLVGGIIGTAIVLFFLLKMHFEFKTIIFIAASISFLSVFPVFFVKAPKIKPIKKTLFQGVHLLDKRLKYFVFVASIFSLANFGLYLFLILIASKITGGFFYPILFYILFNIVFAAFVIPSGELSDKIGRKKILLLGYSLLLVVALGFIFVKNVPGLLVLFALYGLIYAITNPNQRALVSDLSGEMKGTALGYFYTITGLVAIPGGLIAGFLWNKNPDLMFSYISVIAFIALILLTFVKEKKNNNF